MAAEVPFTKLTHEITQIVYKDLHALLDSMSEMDSADRRTRMLDYTARTRHRIIRLLVAVRWHMECSAFHSSAGSLSHIATQRSANFTNSADALWSVAQLVRGAAAHPSAVAYSGELLGPGMTPFRLPRFIERSIDVDTLVRKRPLEGSDEDPYLAPVKRGSRRQFTETEPEMRVRLETKFAVRRALPNGIVVSNWNADPAGVSVRVALPGVWHADLMLNAPDCDGGTFVILEFKILVRTHIDAGGSIRRMNPIDGEPLPMTTNHYNYLRNMMQDRMAWAAHDAKPEDNGEEEKEKLVTDAGREVGKQGNENAEGGAAYKEKGEGAAKDPAHSGKVKVARSDASLRCFCMIMTREICTTLAMDYVREQAAQLALHPAWRKSKLVVHGIGSKAGPLVPVTVEYWKQSSFPAAVTVSIPKDDASGAGDWPNTCGKPDQVVEVSHSPPLPISGNPVSLNLRRVNVESLCLESARRRARQVLSQINHSCKMKTKTISRTALAAHGAAVESLMFDIGNSGFGLYLSMSLRTGAFRVRVRGGTSFALHQRVDKCAQLRRALRKGERHIPGGLAGVERTVLHIIELLMACLQISSCVRQTVMADESALLVWPPGASSVEGAQVEGAERRAPRPGISPPLIPIERSRPVRFLAAQSWLATWDHSAVPKEVPVSKRNRTSPVNFTSSPDGLVFVQGKVPYDLRPRSEKEMRDVACRAESAARWGQLRYATEMRFRRDKLLRELQINAIAVAEHPDYELRSSQRTALILRSVEPLPVARAVLVLCGQKAWRVEVVLEEDIFDDEGAAHVPGLRYVKASRTLVFAYTVADAAAVRRFGEDLIRARGTGALARGVRMGAAELAAAELVVVKSVTPMAIVVEGMNTIIAIGAHAETGAKVAIGTGVFRFDIVLRRDTPVSTQRMRGLLAEVLNADRRNAGQSVLPLLERAIPVIAAAEKAAAASRSAHVTARTALRLYIDFKVGDKRCALDVDGRKGKGRMQLADAARVHELAIASGRQSDPRTAELAHIPSWEAVLDKLVKKRSGMPLHKGAVVVVSNRVLETVITLIVGQGNSVG